MHNNSSLKQYVINIFYYNKCNKILMSDNSTNWSFIK